MRCWLPVLFQFVAVVCCGQNVVPNPSFEQDTACPNGFDQVYFCDSWGTGSFGTPDYYNYCDSERTLAPSFYVPRNWVGYQAAFSGHAYAGIYGYSEVEGPDYHEYLMVQLPPMDTGAYHVSMEVSVADSSGYESDGLGILFNTYGSYPLTTTIPLAPQVSFNAFGVITNKTGWTRLSGSFVADSAYTYAIIGVFKDSAQLFKVPVGGSPFTYYYIDSVIIQKISSLAAPDIPNIANAGFQPNPACSGRTAFSFDNPLGQHCRLQLFDAFGVLRRLWTDVTGSMPVSCSDLPAGLYFYRLSDDNGHACSGRLAVE